MLNNVEITAIATYAKQTVLGHDAMLRGRSNHEVGMPDSIIPVVVTTGIGHS